MRCEVVRQHLLESEQPDQPGSSVARHLLTCAACRAWHYRLTRLERQLARLPAPASEPPAALLAALRPAGAAVVLRMPRSGEHQAARAKELGRRKLALAASLAAALALFAVGLWALPSRGPATVPRTNLDAQARDTARVLAARPRDRAAVLTKIAEEALADAAAHLHQPARVTTQADRFDRVVKDVLARWALEVPAAQREAALGQLADRFREAESKASRLAAEAVARHPDAVAALGRFAATARAADARLRELARRA